MKKILLRVAAVFAEIRFAKGAELRRCHVSFSRKIFLLQDALDPNIDRERAQPFVGEEHDAVRDLGADSRQLAKMRAQQVIGQFPPLFEVRFAAGDESCRGQQIFRSVTQRARPQFPLGQFSDPIRRGEAVHFTIEDSLAIAVSLSQRVRDLADMRHLFHRGRDEGGKAFPARLPNDAQALTEIARRRHRGIARKRTANLRERVIEGEIIRDGLCVDACEGEPAASLFGIDALRGNRAYIPRSTLLPMEDLTRIERPREIEILRSYVRQPHEI